MIALLQRVSGASVSVNDEIIGMIDQGLLVLVGVEKEDTESQSERLVERLLTYRMFADADDKMNLSVTDVEGGVLLVPQFTLAADTRKGKRPSFSSAASPGEAARLFGCFVEQAKQKYNRIETGCFGADMKVSLINDGPVTFWLQA